MRRTKLVYVPRRREVTEVDIDKEAAEVTKELDVLVHGSKENVITEKEITEFLAKNLIKK